MLSGQNGVSNQQHTHWDLPTVFYTKVHSTKHVKKFLRFRTRHYQKAISTVWTSREEQLKLGRKAKALARCTPKVWVILRLLVGREKSIERAVEVVT